MSAAALILDDLRERLAAATAVRDEAWASNGSGSVAATRRLATERMVTAWAEAVEIAERHVLAEEAA